MNDRKRQQWYTYEVRIASRDDRAKFPADQFVSIASLPVRGTYLIEQRNQGVKTLEKKALKLAADDGIPNPIVMSASLQNGPLIC